MSLPLYVRSRRRVVRRPKPTIPQSIRHLFPCYWTPTPLPLTQTPPRARSACRVRIRSRTAILPRNTISPRRLRRRQQRKKTHKQAMALRTRVAENPTPTAARMARRPMTRRAPLTAITAARQRTTPAPRTPALRTRQRKSWRGLRSRRLCLRPMRQHPKRRIRRMAPALRQPQRHPPHRCCSTRRLTEQHRDKALPTANPPIRAILRQQLRRLRWSRPRHRRA